MKYYIELAARWHVFLLMNTYGLGKIAGGQFYRNGALPADVANLTLSEAGGFDIAWTFMGYSYAYIIFIGVSQIVGSWCLLWNKTKFFGIAILVPILVNIIVFDIIFLDTYGALASATIYLLLLMLVLYLNRNLVIEVVKLMISSVNPGIARPWHFKTVGIVSICVAVIFSIEQVLVNIIGH